jgi:hypothetical protein
LAVPEGPWRDVGSAAADDAEGNFDWGEADTPPGSADRVRIYIAEDVNCAINAEGGENRTAAERFSEKVVRLLAHVDLRASEKEYK